MNNWLSLFSQPNYNRQSLYGGLMQLSQPLYNIGRYQQRSFQMPSFPQELSEEELLALRLQQRGNQVPQRGLVALSHPSYGQASSYNPQLRAGGTPQGRYGSPQSIQNGRTPPYIQATARPSGTPMNRPYL